MHWSDEDRRWAEHRQVALTELERQIGMVAQGPRCPHLTEPCRAGLGIASLDPELRNGTLSLVRHAIRGRRLSHFVPASGAASRMFSAVVKAHHAGFTSDADLADAVATSRPELASALTAYRGRHALAAGEDLASASLGETLTHWVDTLGLPELPKGLVPYHAYPTGVRTAVEEQVLEAAALTTAEHGVLNLHFTVPAGHEAAFRAAVARVTPLLARQGFDIALTLSVQHPSTDTVAVTPDGEVFRTDDGAPLMRPGGHGALLRNLDALQGDVVMLKNIDNVVRADHREPVVRWRRALLGRLLSMEASVHEHCRALLRGAPGDEALQFAEAHFGIRPTSGTVRERALHALWRPLRVCGVVRNEGQPGGGPFWVRGADGSVTPQIVESAQMDLEDPAQRAVFQSATHFNPVDIVASLRDPEGRPFALADFIDDTAWILASKTHQGRPLRALERPGLWNGAMAGWNTLFVEIPSNVFRPVKELADLLKSGHVAPPVAGHEPRSLPVHAFARP